MVNVVCMERVISHMERFLNSRRYTLLVDVEL